MVNEGDLGLILVWEDTLEIRLLIKLFSYIEQCFCVFTFSSQTLTFLFCIGLYLINNVEVVSGEQQRVSDNTHVSILPPHLLPSRLTHDIEQNSMYYTVVFLLVIHFKYSSAYMTFPKSLTIPSSWQP